MAVIGKPADPWGGAHFVFASDGERLGQAAFVTGLDEALDVAAGRGGNDLPDIVVAGMDQDLDKWTHSTFNRGEQLDFVIRDNRKARWVRLHRAFVRNLSGSGACTWSINGVENADGPF